MVVDQQAIFIFIIISSIMTTEPIILVGYVGMLSALGSYDFNHHARTNYTMVSVSIGCGTIYLFSYIYPKQSTMCNGYNARPKVLLLI